MMRKGIDPPHIVALTIVVHVTIHADDSNRLGLYDTDGKALLANGKDE